MHVLKISLRAFQETPHYKLRDKSLQVILRHAV